jgi:hypothetical protein
LPDGAALTKETTMAEHKKYDINEASKEDLAQVPGVDDRMAEAKDMDQLREWLTTASERSGSLGYEGQREEPDVV